MQAQAAELHVNKTATQRKPHRNDLHLVTWRLNVEKTAGRKEQKRKKKKHSLREEELCRALSSCMMLPGCPRRSREGTHGEPYAPDPEALIVT